MVRFPWSKGQGLIEASKSPVLPPDRSGPFLGRKAKASLKHSLSDLIGENGFSFLGRKAKASLKPVTYGEHEAKAIGFPWSKGQGLIEASRHRPARRSEV